jgi:hypothetical protein
MAGPSLRHHQKSSRSLTRPQALCQSRYYPKRMANEDGAPGRGAQRTRPRNHHENTTKTPRLHHTRLARVVATVWTGPTGHGCGGYGTVQRACLAATVGEGSPAPADNGERLCLRPMWCTAGTRRGPPQGGKGGEARDDGKRASRRDGRTGQRARYRGHTD